MCSCSCGFLTPPEESSGWRAARRNSVLWRTVRTDFQIVRYLGEPILWAQFLYLLTSRKATKILHSNDCFPWLAEIFRRLVESFWKNMGLIACTLPSSKSHKYCLSPHLFGAASQCYLSAVSSAIIFILPPIKLNLQLSCCSFFLSRHNFPIDLQKLLSSDS